MKKLYFSFYFRMSSCRSKMKALMLFMFALHGVQAQIYTLQVEPQEVNEILGLKDPLEIPTFEIQGLTNAEIENLRTEDEKRAKQGNPPRVAVPIQTHINTGEQGIWINLGDRKAWLLEVKAKNATQLAPIFRNLNLKSGSEIWIFTAHKTLLMGPITSENIPQKVERTVTDFLPDEALQGAGDFGVTQGGSSGASLLNENHLVCGQNFGGELTNCNQVGERTKDYGRLGVSWNGDGALGNRLSDFLAPNPKQWQ